MPDGSSTESETVSRRGGRRTSPRQQQKNQETRRKLIEAAAKVVGEHGYAGASIARITAEAGVAHGAFYLHFASRQELFDSLLPHIGRDMIAQIGRAVRDASDLEKVEARGVTANLKYIEDNPSLSRIMREAEAVAPETYRAFIAILHERYLASLIRSRQEGEIEGFDEEELSIVATMMMGARDFLIQRYFASGTGEGRVPQKAIEVYLRFMLAGLTQAAPKAEE